MDETSVEETAKQTNLMGIHFVRPPILDFNKLKDTNKYVEYEIITDYIIKEREGDEGGLNNNHLNSFIFLFPII